MAEILQTSTELTIVGNNFTLLTEYSGETNPNVTFDVLFTVTDGSVTLEGVSIVIGVNSYITDANGQVSISLTRGNYIANISFSGYTSQSSIFTILDQDINQNITLILIGSFGESYDDSYEK